MNGDQDGPSIAHLPPTNAIKESLKNGTLEYWKNRQTNVSYDSMRQIVNYLPDGGVNENFKMKWMKRESESGKFGLIGEKEVFEIKFRRNFMGKKKYFYLKGYFYPEGDIKGVELQSCRDVTDDPSYSF